MSERSAVQNPMLKYADEIGWQQIAPDEALRLRGGETGLYFTDILKAQLLSPSLKPKPLRKMTGWKKALRRCAAITAKRRKC